MLCSKRCFGETAGVWGELCVVTEMDTRTTHTRFPGIHNTNTAIKRNFEDTGDRNATVRECRLLTSANEELQSPSRGTDRQTAGLEIAHLLRNPKFHCHALKGQLLTASKSNCNQSTPIQPNSLSKQQNYLYELRQWAIRS